MRNALTIALAATLALTALPVLAVTNFDAVLLGVNEVPPNASPATGYGTLVLNDTQTQLAFTISYSGLVASETAAHIHKAPPGANGSAVFGLPLGSPKTGTWSLSASNVTDLLAGNLYVNVHSTVFPGGEIRGQIMRVVPEPGSIILLASGVGMLVLRRRK